MTGRDERRGALLLVHEPVPAAARWPRATLLPPSMPAGISCRRAGMGARRHRQRRSDPRRHQEWLCRNARVALRDGSDPAEGEHRPMIMMLEILPNAVDDLCRLGWLDGADHRVDAAVLDAVAELVERAIALRLRPY